MLLKRFTYFRIPMRKPLLRQYDTEKGIERLVSIESCCRKDYLYELYDENGNILSLNYLESRFSIIENMCNIVIDKLEQNYMNCFNFETNKLVNFKKLFYLTEYEKRVLILYIVLQYFRTPKMQVILYNKIKEYIESAENNESEDDKLVKSFVKVLSLDYERVLQGNFDEIEFELQLVKLYFVNLMHSKLVICFSKFNYVMNSDLPVVYFNDELITKTPLIGEALWLFPISAHICLMLTKNELNEKREEYRAIKEKGVFYMNYTIMKLYAHWALYKESDKGMYNLLSAYKPKIERNKNNDVKRRGRCKGWIYPCRWETICKWSKADIRVRYSGEECRTRNRSNNYIQCLRIQRGNR